MGAAPVEPDVEVQVLEAVIVAQDPAHVPHEIFLPVKPGRPEGYGGKGATFRWPENVHEVAAEEVRNLAVDCVLSQSHRNWTRDREEILSPSQRALPAIHLEHDPPR